MRIFMVEWWSEVQGKYLQEYFHSISDASTRIEALDEVEGACPKIHTVQVY